MFRIAANICIYICATLLATKCVLGQLHHHHQKPWPTYSLQNMPQTRFTCHDKILGGYYADAETQCQMFHVCVKVAGGVQDFRFLCPNSTAFDQEAQICADWGDVDCEQSVLYYGSDNFDLYRIGSGFESKRAPLAEEEEATYHLQRAESADTRRSKETRVDQKLRPDQPPNYAKHFVATTRNPHNYANLAAQRNPQKNNYNNYNNNYNNNNNKNNDDAGEYNVKRLPEAVAKQPIVNYYTPTTTTTTTTTTKKPTTTSTTERYNDESKQDFDDIFKGSHSSNFFANRNGGREDDFHDHSTKTKYNDFNEYSPKNVAETSTTGKTRVQPTRGHSRRIQKPQQTPSTITTTTQNTTPPTKTTKKLSQQTYYQNSNFAGITQHYKTTTVKPVKTSTILTTARPGDSNFNYRSNYNAHDYHTQDKIQPTTYNPVNSAYRLKTTTPKYTELQVGAAHEGTLQKPSKTKIYKDQYEVPTGFGKTGTSQTRRKSNSQGLVSAQNSTFVNHKEFSEFSKIPNTQEPHPFQPAKVFRPPPISKANENQKTDVNQTEIRSRSRGQTIKSRDYQEPAPFIAANHNQRLSNAHNKLKLTTSTSPSPPVSQQQPRGFASRGRINYKATTTRGDFDNYNNYYTPTSNAPKKFSTLVPKEQTFQPTTFKPTTYKKAYENSYFELQQKQQHQKQYTGRPQSINSTQTPTTTTDYNPDEDDGQYHPELYEQDFPKNKLKLQRTTTSTTSTTTSTSKSTNYPQSHLKTQQQSFFQKQQQQQQRHDLASDSADLSDEDELFKTAHSLNFGAASINKLRADILKAEKTSQQYNLQYALNQQSSSPPTGAPSYLPTTSTSSYSYPTYAPTSTTYSNTNKPFTTFTTTPATTTLKTTTRPIINITTTTTRQPLNTQAPTAVTAKSHHKSSGKKSSGKHKKTHKSASKRPPHADEDTSYDYAYYDSDTLSESPQEYPEYEISEFTKTRKN